MANDNFSNSSNRSSSKSSDSQRLRQGDSEAAHEMGRKGGKSRQGSSSSSSGSDR